MEVSMPDNTLFRKVLFGGYHKGDVLSYIENLEAEKESLKFSLQEAETKEPELPPELKAEYESTIAQLQEQVASLKKSPRTVPTSFAHSGKKRYRSRAVRSGKRRI